MIDIPGIILAGGLSRRMGGGDKGLLMLGKTTIIERVIDKISPQVGSLAININGDSSRFPDYKLPIIPDSIKGYLGPLSGILAGMEWAFKNGNRYIATVAADTPFLPDDLIKRLHAMVKSKNLNIGIAASRFLRRDDVFIHPTFGIWEVALKDDLRDALANDTRKIMFWAKKFKLDYYYFDTSDKLSDPFFNINTPDDLEEAKYRLKKGLL
jgi:molybdopterin-guanine dinucleotide biosynthesis protein A